MPILASLPTRSPTSRQTRHDRSGARGSRRRKKVGTRSYGWLLPTHCVGSLYVRSRQYMPHITEARVDLKDDCISLAHSLTHSFTYCFANHSLTFTRSLMHPRYVTHLHKHSRIHSPNQPSHHSAPFPLHTHPSATQGMMPSRATSKKRISA